MADRWSIVLGSAPANGSTVTAAASGTSLPNASERGARAQAFARVSIHADVAAVAADWTRLEQAASISAYQTLRWMKPWIETTGRSNGVRPMIVAAHDREGRAVAILPLGIRKIGPVRRATFLGGRDANFNLGLFHPELRWSAEDVRALLKEAAAAARGGVDLFDLRNQPVSWRNVANPLACLPRLASPSFGSLGRLQPDAAAFFAARISSETQKTLRKKARRLAKHFGPLRHVTATEEPQVRAVLAAFQAQKSARLRTLGLSDLFADGATMAFLTRATLEGLPSAAVELHALYAGNRIVATFGGAPHAGRFSGMFISFDDELEIARSSPGDQLLHFVVAQKCAAGFEAFDLGIGEALYKTSYCDEVEPMFDAVVPVTPLGHTFTLALRRALRLKRFAKQTPWAWGLVRAARRWRSRIHG